jgi:hypothetical protein
MAAGHSRRSSLGNSLADHSGRALGGLLASVVALRVLDGFAGPYGLPIVMAVLKVPSGALTGLLGALWMQNAVFGVLRPQDGRKILAYVAVFGFAQQAFTTFADRQGKPTARRGQAARQDVIPIGNQKRF